MKILKYKKLLALVAVIILTYIAFSNPTIRGAIQSIGNLGYLGVFLVGILFPFGFTAPFAVGFFVTLNPINPILTAVIGGLGATVCNMFIFSLIRISFMKEFRSLEREEPLKELSILIKRNVGHRMRVYLLYIFIGLVLASPLPDEIADVLIAGLTHVRAIILAPIMFVLSVIGIWVLVSI